MLSRLTDNAVCPPTLHLSPLATPFSLSLSLFSIQRHAQWSTIEAEVKAGHEGIIHEQKIRCAFLPPIEDMEGNGGGLSTSGTPSTFSNGTPSRYETVKGSSSDPANETLDRSMNNGADSPHAVDAKENPGDATAPLDSFPSSIPKSAEEAKAVASNAASAVTGAAAGAAASLGLASAAPSSSSGSGSARTSTMATGNTTTTTSSDVATLQRELAAARAEIEKLKELVRQKENEASSGLRQRNLATNADSKPASGSSIAGAQTATVTQEGIPLPMVAAIAGAVFFFTW